MKISNTNFWIGIFAGVAVAVTMAWKQKEAGVRSIVSQTDVYTKSLITVRHDDHLFVIYSGVWFMHHPGCACGKGVAK